MLLFLVTPYLVVAVQPCMEWIPSKKKCQIFSCPSPNLLILILQIPLNTSSCFAFGLETFETFLVTFRNSLVFNENQQVFCKKGIMCLIQVQFFKTQMLFPWVAIIYQGCIFLTTKVFESWISIDTRCLSMFHNVSFVLPINNIRECNLCTWRDSFQFFAYFFDIS